MTRNEAQKILNNPATHFWVKELAQKLDNHDVCDVLHGLELLREIFKSKFEGLMLNK